MMISFNTNGAKRNLLFIKELLIYDIIYLFETWLMDYESKNLLNILSVDHLMFHHSDMLISPTKSLPYDGRALFIRKNITVIKYEFVNK